MPPMPHGLITLAQLTEAQFDQASGTMRLLFSRTSV
jgi:hypothetical protein